MCHSDAAAVAAWSQEESQVVLQHASFSAKRSSSVQLAAQLWSGPHPHSLQPPATLCGAHVTLGPGIQLMRAFRVT